MERDDITGEIEELLRQPMGHTAREVTWTWLQRYRQRALDAVSRGATREEREANAGKVRQELLELLQTELPVLIDRERRYEEAIAEATERATRVYDERFEQEVQTTLEDPAFSRATAERIADSELYTFRRELAREVADLVEYHRGQLREHVDRLLKETE